jgi:IPT/TIG domain
VANLPAPGRAEGRKEFTRAKIAVCAAVAFIVLLAPRLGAQNSPHLTSVDPQSGSANDTITLTGEHLEKAHVSAVFLSDDKEDHKAVVVSQATDKIVIKVPSVKAGEYNISVQEGNAILIEPVRFTVQ